MPTCNTNLERNSISNSKTLYLRTNGNNLTRGLMTQREGMASAEVAVGEFLIVRNV